MSRTLFENLSIELLIKIFEYLDLDDLCKIRQTCKRFYIVINSWDHVILKTNNDTIVTNQVNDDFLNRCWKKLSKLEKIRIERNWRNGKYKETKLFFVKKKYMPWITLDSTSLWFSRGHLIFNYRRNDRVVKDKPCFVLSVAQNSDLTKFKIKNDHLVSASREGSIFLWSLYKKRKILEQSDCHTSDINSVDVSSNMDIIVSGSRDNYFKIWNVYRSDEDVVLRESYHQFLQDRVWCVSLSDDKPLIAVGSSGIANRNCLRIYDIERLSEKIVLPFDNYGCGVLDIKWDGPDVLWSCGYDSYLRRWDLRTGQCEQIFEDPCASVLYCFDYDYCNTIMTGTQMHGRVVLWDTRQKNCVQFFFMKSCKNERKIRSSPIYSLSFDSEYLFAATDQNINVLDFSTFDGNINDYSYFTKISR